MLVQNLPPTGAYGRAVNETTWTDAEYLLANIVDAVQFGTHGVVSVLGGKPKKPEAQQRPHDDRGKRTGNRGEHTADDVVTYLDQFKAAKEG